MECLGAWRGGAWPGAGSARCPASGGILKVFVVAVPFLHDFKLVVAILNSILVKLKYFFSAKGFVYL